MSTSLGPDLNIGGSALGVIWTLTSLALIVVIARCWTQYKITHQLGLSDALVIVSVCTIISFASLISAQYYYGWGRHYEYLTPDQQLNAIRLNWIGQPFGVMGSTWGRLSFIILMLQLFGTSKWRRRGLWFLFWAQLIPNGVVVITQYVQCPRVDALWDFSIHVKCWAPEVQTYIGYAHTAWNGATDLFLTCLPATMLWNLQMDKRLKLGLGFLLSLSFLAFVAVIMKIIKLRALSEKGDYTFNTVSLFTWVIVESTLVATAASVPLLRPLFKKIRRSLTTKNTHTSSTYYPSHAKANYELDKYGGGLSGNSNNGNNKNRYGVQNSILSQHSVGGVFSKLGSVKGKGKGKGTGRSDGVGSRNGLNRSGLSRNGDGDAESEEGILPMQGTRSLEGIEGSAGSGVGGASISGVGGIVKETTFSVRVRSLREEDDEETKIGGWGDSGSGGR